MDHSTYTITWLNHLGFGWGVGRDHSTYIITWLSHLGFGWGGGEGSFYLHHYLNQPLVGEWEGSFYLHHCLAQPFRVWLGGWGGIILLIPLLDSAISGFVGGRDHSSYRMNWHSHSRFGWGVGRVCENVLLPLGTKTFMLHYEPIFSCTCTPTWSHTITSSLDAIIIMIMVKMKMNNTRKKKMLITRMMMKKMMMMVMMMMVNMMVNP